PPVVRRVGGALALEPAPGAVAGARAKDAAGAGRSRRGDAAQERIRKALDVVGVQQREGRRADEVARLVAEDRLAARADEEHAPLGIELGDEVARRVEEELIAVLAFAQRLDEARRAIGEAAQSRFAPAQGLGLDGDGGELTAESLDLRGQPGHASPGVAHGRRVNALFGVTARPPSPHRQPKWILRTLGATAQLGFSPNFGMRVSCEIHERRYAGEAWCWRALSGAGDRIRDLEARGGGRLADARRGIEGRREHAAVGPWTRPPHAVAAGLELAQHLRGDALLGLDHARLRL